MNRENFIAASTSTRIYEDDLLKARDLERLNDYGSLREVINGLNDSSYASFIAELDRDEDYEEILNKELVRVYEKISEVTPDKNISQYLLEKYNFHNLKLVVKEIIQEEDYSKIYSPMANIDTAYIKRELIKLGDDELILDEIGEKDERNIYLAYAKEAIDSYKESENPAMIEIGRAHV